MTENIEEDSTTHAHMYFCNPPHVHIQTYKHTHMKKCQKPKLWNTIFKSLDLRGQRTEEGGLRLQGRADGGEEGGLGGAPFCGRVTGTWCKKLPD